ncbi:MAG TPA: DUF1465 family protein [Xanthobacteraceae bacterium]|nr:DUF1465 family protein [Xanthobacteraceae bacterium]
MAQASKRGEAAVSFGERLAASPSFDGLFREGMDLIERTAAYLDGPGRAERSTLDRAGSHAFADHSLRLTARLMQLASWLLLQRAVNEGEMTAAEAVREKAKVDLGRAEPLDEDEAGRLPSRLADLVTAARALQQRVLNLDAALDWNGAPLREANPVMRQLGRLRGAFEGG